MSVNSEKTVWVLNDGRRGHWRQARALAGYLPADVMEMRFKLRNPWRLFAPRSLPFGLPMHPSLRAAVANGTPAAIISCGRQSALVARWLQRELGQATRTVQILNCGLNPERFSWVVVPAHDQLAGPNVIQSQGSLNPVDDTWLAQAAADAGELQALNQPRATLLLGGPSRHFDFSRSWFSRRLTELLARLGRHRGSLILVGSPRTPAWVAEVIDAANSDVPRHWIPWTQPVAAGQDRQYIAAIAHADCLIVTADSVNLVSEACASGKPVTLIGGRRIRGRISLFCKHMTDSGYVRELDQFDFGALPVTLCLRETEKIAAVLIDAGLLSG